VTSKRLTLLERFHTKYIIDPITGCWNWTGYISPSGYGRHSGKEAHRHAYRTLKGPIPEDCYVCHTCDNKICVNPDHLFIGTPQDNNRDCVEKGRRPKHQQRTNRRLTEADREFIHNYPKNYGYKAELARILGVSYHQVHDCIKNNTPIEKPSYKPRNVKLTEQDVLQIRSHKKYHGYMVELANKFKVSPFTIRDIVTNRTWNNL